MFKLSELEVIINTTIMKYNTGSEYNVKRLESVSYTHLDVYKRQIYYNVFNDPGFTDQMCGPLAIPVAPELFIRVIYF